MQPSAGSGWDEAKAEEARRLQIFVSVLENVVQQGSAVMGSACEIPIFSRKQTLGDCLSIVDTRIIIDRVGNLCAGEVNVCLLHAASFTITFKVCLSCQLLSCIRCSDSGMLNSQL